MHVISAHFKQTPSCILRCFRGKTSPQTPLVCCWWKRKTAISSFFHQEMWSDVIRIIKCWNQILLRGKKRNKKWSNAVLVLYLSLEKKGRPQQRASPHEILYQGVDWHLLYFIRTGKKFSVDVEPETKILRRPSRLKHIYNILIKRLNRDCGTQLNESHRQKTEKKMRCNLLWYLQLKQDNGSFWVLVSNSSILVFNSF